MLTSFALKEPIHFNENIESVDKCIYLGIIMTQTGDIDVEIKKIFGLVGEMLLRCGARFRRTEKVKKRRMDMYIVPVKTYAVDTWSLWETHLESLTIAQRKHVKTDACLTTNNGTWVGQQAYIEDSGCKIN